MSARARPCAALGDARMGPLASPAALHCRACRMQQRRCSAYTVGPRRSSGAPLRCTPERAILAYSTGSGLRLTNELDRLRLRAGVEYHQQCAGACRVLAPGAQAQRWFPIVGSSELRREALYVSRSRASLVGPARASLDAAVRVHAQRRIRSSVDRRSAGAGRRYLRGTTAGSAGDGSSANSGRGAAAQRRRRDGEVRESLSACRMWDGGCRM